MKKLWILLLICGFISACSDNSDSTANLPQECKDAFSHWDTLLAKMRASGRFADQALTYFENNKNT